MSREEFKRDWVKKATDFNAKRSKYETTFEASRAAKDKEQPKNEREWYKHPWRSQWGKMWESYKRDPVRFAAGQEEQLMAEEADLVKELESLVASQAPVSVKSQDTKVTYGAIPPGALFGALAKAYSGISNGRSSLGSTCVEVPASQPLPSASAGVDNEALAMLAKAAAERMKGEEEKKKEATKKRKLEKATKNEKGEDKKEAAAKKRKEKASKDEKESKGDTAPVPKSAAQRRGRSKAAAAATST